MIDEKTSKKGAKQTQMDEIAFGKRLCAARNHAELSQEELAERASVTRQAVSQWESGRSLPDVDKLAALCKALGTSMDVLAYGEEARTQRSQAQNGLPFFLYYHYEYKSKRTWLGLPLFHINIGYRRGKPYIAKGIFAFGTVAIGVVSLGVLALGGVAFGALSLGVLALGALAAGGGAFGAIAAGLVACGGVAAGVLAFGGVSLGQYAVGGAAIASRVAIGDYAHAHVAIGHTSIGDYVLQSHRASNLSTLSAADVRALILRVYPHIPAFVLRFLTLFCGR